MYFGLITISVFALCTNGNTYHGQQMMTVVPQTAQQYEDLLAYLDAAEMKVLEEDIRQGQQMLFLVPGEAAETVTDHINQQLNLKVEVIIEDVGRIIANEKNRLDQQRKQAHEEGRLAFNISDYNTYEDTMSQLEVFASQCADISLTCEVITAGQSYEGNDVNYLTMSSDPDDESRLGIWIDSLIHPREWIVGPTTMNMIDRFLTDYGSDDTVTDLLDTYNWYFMPIVNPDGYLWTWSDDRMWRKSRNINNDSICIGTDLNRNFDEKWMNAGASPNPCRDIYGGSRPASEPETQIMQGLADSLGPTLRAWISMHAWSNIWLHPLGSVDDEGNCERSADHDDQYQAAEAAAFASADTYGTNWTYGPICETFYPAAASNCDYAYAKGGVKYSYTPELRDDGYGFFVPPEQIPLAFEETWNGLVALIEEAERIEGSK